MPKEHKASRGCKIHTVSQKIITIEQHKNMLHKSLQSPESVHKLHRNALTLFSWKNWHVHSNCTHVCRDIHSTQNIKPVVKSLLHNLTHRTLKMFYFYLWSYNNVRQVFYTKNSHKLDFHDHFLHSLRPLGLIKMKIHCPHIKWETELCCAVVADLLLDTWF